MRLLELFSGTGSIGNVFKEHGWEVISLDKDMPADIQMDILNWDYRNSPYQPKYFDVIWSSPPCTEYSRAKTVGIRQFYPGVKRYHQSAAHHNAPYSR